MRGATPAPNRSLFIHRYFNPRTPCGVRRSAVSKSSPPMTISIHAPHAGCDIQATKVKEVQDVISIHAPHAGCDRRPAPISTARPTFQSTHPMRGATCSTTTRLRTTAYFNPRTPCGVRLLILMTPLSLHSTFQSTHPMRGATRCRPAHRGAGSYFNPRTPCGVRRHDVKVIDSKNGDFNPRTPCGVRPIIGKAVL